MAPATARLSLPQFVPISIRSRTRERPRARSQSARAAQNEPPKKKLPFPMPSPSTSPSSRDAPPPPPPPPWPRAVSLDVEFSHYQREQSENAGDDDDDDGESRLVLRVPADVAVVSDEGEVLLRALVSPPPGVAAAAGWVGGVPREETAAAGPSSVVAMELARLLSAGCLLVGHGVVSDLRALGGDVVAVGSGPSASPPPCASASPSLSIPASRVRDTSTSAGLLKMQRHKRSSSRKLDELFLGAFGLELRPSSGPFPATPPSSSSSSASPPPPPAARHDPVADAAAAMALYLTFVKGTLDDASSAAELEEMETERVLQEFRARARENA